MRRGVSKSCRPALVGLLLVSGCATTDPYLKPAQWQPVGANARNLAAMVANPNDLIRGHGDRYTVGSQAAVPVTALLAGKAAPLPSSSSESAPSGSNAPAPPAPN